MSRSEMHITVIFFIVSHVLIVSSHTLDESSSITYLNIGEHRKFALTQINPVLICMREQNWIFLTWMAFQTYFFDINSTSQSSTPFTVYVYHAPNEEQLRIQAPWRNHNLPASYGTSFFAKISQSSVSHSPFEVTKNMRVPFPGLHSHCVALLPADSQPMSYNSVYEIAFTHSLDFNRLLRLIIGIILYFSADLLCKSVMFYYFSGVSLTVLGSFLILIILGLRLFPQRTSIFIQGLVLISGGAVSLLFFCLDKLRNVIGSFIANNIGLFILYVLFVSLSAIIIFYWLHLPEVLLERFPRTITLLKLFMRFFGIVLIASSPQLPSEIKYLNLIGSQATSYINDYLNLDISALCSVIDSSSGTLIRILCGVCAAVGLHFLSLLVFTSSEKSRRFSTSSMRRQKSANLLPPIPCAASSPAPGASFDRRPIFSPPPYYDESPFGDRPHRRFTSGSFGRWNEKTFSPVLPNRNSMFQTRRSTSFVNGSQFIGYPKSMNITPPCKYAQSYDFLTDDED